MTIHAVDDWRRPGCGDTCERVSAMIVNGPRRVAPLVLHDPATHERWGAVHLLPPTPSVVQTGPLEIDFARREVRAGGRRVGLTPKEFGVLCTLAWRMGRSVSHATLLAKVWGASYLTDRHVLRVTVARLRDALGAAGALIVTQAHHGYLLESVPPCDLSGIEPRPSRATIRAKRAAHLAALLSERMGEWHAAPDLLVALTGRRDHVEVLYQACDYLAACGAAVEFVRGRGGSGPQNHGRVRLLAPFALEVDA